MLSSGGKRKSESNGIQSSHVRSGALGEADDEVVLSILANGR